MADPDRVQAAVNRLTGFTQHVQVDVQEWWNDREWDDGDRS